MARLFTAIELTERARAAVEKGRGEILRALGPAATGLRAVHPEHLHLTLVFLGEIADARVPLIREAMAADLDVNPFGIEFGGCGVFPPHGQPRVLWLGLERGAAACARLHEMVAGRLEALGVPREARRFTPHLTLGRWKERVATRARLQLPDVPHVAVQQVAAVTLFHSRLTPTGPEHTVLAQARLVETAGRLH
jgi:2'-5' RNA ligase